MRLAHVVVTDAFAGTERYVVEVCRRLAERGHDVVVIGGDESRMREGLGRARWSPGPTPRTALQALRRVGRRDVVHAHLTAAEAVATAGWISNRGHLVSTRHIAARRGTTAAGRAASVVLRRSLGTQLAISDFVRDSVREPVDAVLHNGVLSSGAPYDPSSRVVLVLQRLEREKATDIALSAFMRSGLAAHGWELHVAGDGSQRAELERLVAGPGGVGIRFLGAVTDVPQRLAQAAVVLAPAPAEPLGLSVLEAMSAGRPVVAASGGGHLETLGDCGLLFRPGDVAAAASQLQRLASDQDLRQAVGAAARRRQRELFDVEAHVQRLEELYASTVKPAARRGPLR